MDPLARLFGTPARLKLLRLFLFNDDAAFSLADAAERSRTPKAAARKELALLLAAGVIKKRRVKTDTGRSVIGYAADKRFVHAEPLRAFLRTTTSVSDSGIVSSLKKSGTVRLVVLTGLFTRRHRAEDRPAGSGGQARGAAAYGGRASS